VVWVVPEVQSAARLALCWLRTTPATEAERCRRIMAQAHFLGASREHRSGGLAAPYPGVRWSDARIEELRVDASAWLEQQWKAMQEPVG
jgi:hypothetical protein